MLKKNDIYIFFETMKQLEPHSILDIGMFFKRIGAVSRNAMDEEIPENIIFDGVSLEAECVFPIYDTVYNSVMEMERFMTDESLDMYELIVILGNVEIPSNVSLDKLMCLLGQRTRYILTDRTKSDWKNRYTDREVIALSVEHDDYYLIDFGV